MLCEPGLRENDALLDPLAESDSEPLMDDDHDWLWLSEPLAVEVTLDELLALIVTVAVPEDDVEDVVDNVELPVLEALSVAEEDNEIECDSDVDSVVVLVSVTDLLPLALSLPLRVALTLPLADTVPVFDGEPLKLPVRDGVLESLGVSDMVGV